MGFSLGKMPPKRDRAAEQAAASAVKSPENSDYKTFIPQAEIPPGDPLDGARSTGNIEKDDAEESKRVKTEISRVTASGERLSNMGYYTCVVFPDQATCHEFMQKAGWTDDMEDDFGAFVDGLAVAKKMGIILNAIPPIRFTGQRVDKLSVETLGIHEPPTAITPKRGKAKNK